MDSAPQNSLLCDWSMFSNADLMQKNFLSQAASGMISQNQGRLPVSIISDKIAALGSLKRVTGRISKISK